MKRQGYKTVKIGIIYLTLLMKLITIYLENYFLIVTLHTTGGKWTKPHGVSKVIIADRLGRLMLGRFFQLPVDSKQ
jgi:hypothetical protein